MCCVIQRTGLIKMSIFALITSLLGFCVQIHGKELLVLTVATEANDGFRRFMDTAEKFDVSVKVLGMGQPWLGGDMSTVGGGHKVILLKEEMEHHRQRDDLVVMFVDSYDVVFTSTPKEILAVFDKFDARVVFSAEGFCWPDKTLVETYPEVAANEKRFLNSGGFIGYAPDVYAVVTHADIAHGDDDQLYYTRIFLDGDIQGKKKIKLDTRSEIFQNLNGALDEVQVKFKGENSYLYNMKTGSIPIVVHGNGPVKVELNSLANYLADSWTPKAGCQNCDKNRIDLTIVKNEDLPLVYVSVHIEHATPFVDIFFQLLASQEYPKKRMHLLIHNMVAYHTKHVEAFMSEHADSYMSATVLPSDEQLEPVGVRNMAVDKCIAAECDYYLSLDAEAHLENNRSIHLLIERNRSVVNPLLVRPGKMWSTFWGALSDDGYYKRSDDYSDIVLFKKIGMWNMPFIANAYMIKKEILPKIIGAFSAYDSDYDMSFCRHLREKNIFMMVDNTEYYGYLINSEEFDTSIHSNNDLWQMFTNAYAWDKKYISREYYTQLEPGYKVEEPCTDVYWFPMFTPQFCQELIAEVEDSDLWSGGKHEDPRISGGYENVPTDDVHMKQISFEQEWLHLLQQYVKPFNAKFYSGYYTESRAIMNFMVRYKPNLQDRLRPHHDSSTYTINTALNRVGVDYEGGGVRFTRYNCSVTQLRQGWTLMHPGRLTHEHEGLPTTAGTRYIMISFIDP